MKIVNGMFALTLSLSSAWTAQAVTVAKCPKTITVELERFDLYSDKQFLKHNDNSVLYSEGIQEDALFARDSLKDIAIWDESDTPSFALEPVVLSLYQTSSGRCSYTNTSVGYTPGYEVETRFYTRNGRDILRIAVPVGKEPREVRRGAKLWEEVWIYKTVTAYSKEGLEIAPVKASPIEAGFDHGAPRAVIGWASALNVK